MGIKRGAINNCTRKVHVSWDCPGYTRTCGHSSSNFPVYSCNLPSSEISGLQDRPDFGPKSLVFTVLLGAGAPPSHDICSLPLLFRTPERPEGHPVALVHLVQQVGAAPHLLLELHN